VEPVVLILRLVHVMGGAFWFGAALLMAVFIEPAAAELGPDGGRFLQKLMATRRLAAVMTGAAAATVLAGLGLFIRDSGLAPGWVLSGPGLGFLGGGLAGLGAFGLGFFFTRPAAEELSALGRRLAGGGPPEPELLKRVGQLEAALRRYSLAGAALLVGAVALMAVARYLP
jgi:hypothetical protein